MPVPPADSRPRQNNAVNVHEKAPTAQVDRDQPRCRRAMGRFRRPLAICVQPATSPRIPACKVGLISGGLLMVMRISLVMLMCLAVVVPQTSRAQTPPAATCPEMATALTALMRNDARLRDWPNLARYRDDDKAVASSGNRAGRVVFMGDSITDIWQQPRFGGFFP